MGKNVWFMRSAMAVALLSMFMMVVPAFAQSIFVIGQGSTDVGGTGWYAGYVITGVSGTYTLNISITGGANAFPFSNIKVIALVSNESVLQGGLAKLIINGTQIDGFEVGKPAYFWPNGGPFSEPDFYGYNDTYVIPELTYAEAHHPDNWVQLPVTVEFSSTATEASKVMFVCYGFDVTGKDAKTPFSGGTMFVVPEVETTLIGFSAFACAFGFYAWKRRGKALP